MGWLIYTHGTDVDLKIIEVIGKSMVIAIGMRDKNLMKYGMVNPGRGWHTAKS